MRSGNLHGVNLAVVRVNPEEKCVLGPDQYVKHIDLEAVCLEEPNYGGSLLLSGQNKSELLLRGEQEDLIRSGGQASGILLRPLVVAIRALAVVVARFLFDADLRTASESANRWLAVHLIGSVDAVVLPVATIALRDAVVVLALELVMPALRQRRTHRIGLILVLAAIIDAVTERRVPDAQLVAALEGVGMAVGLGTGL